MLPALVDVLTGSLFATTSSLFMAVSGPRYTPQSQR
jgi:hypothetical protein